jgi:glucose-6-phosphate 1-dehydrogenase
MEVKNVSMDFKYQDYFGKQLSTGYETLLFDCIMGDATLFRREDQVDLAWQIVTPILNVWNEQKTPQIPYYNSGTWGPKEADDLLARDGRIWRDIQQ